MRRRALHKVIIRNLMTRKTHVQSIHFMAWNSSDDSMRVLQRTDVLSGIDLRIFLIICIGIMHRVCERRSLHRTFLKGSLLILIHPLNITQIQQAEHYLLPTYIAKRWC